MPGKKLTLAELKALVPGEKVYVRYQNYDEDVPRLDGEFDVLENNSSMLVVDDGMGPEEFCWDTWNGNTFVESGGEGTIRRVR